MYGARYSGRPDFQGDDAHSGSAHEPERKPPQGMKLIPSPYSQRTYIFSGFWAQRPYYVRLLGYFDAKGSILPVMSLHIIILPC